MPEQQKSVEEILLANGHYPPAAFEFVQRGLAWTVQQLERADKPEGERHVSGQELCEGIRDLALAEFGHMARVVLANWNIHKTDDFGKIVFYLIDHMMMQKRPEDRIEDFRNAYDFIKAFDRGYKIDLSQLGKGEE